ncbi:MAG: response regulator transcription factor [Planctomycetota bacterium]
MSTTSRHILVVEDDGAIRQGVVDALEFEGFQVTEAADGARGLDLALSMACDLVLLDLAMPKKDGIEVLGELRGSKPTLPVIIMTARGDEQDRVKGLKLGADDYVVKPFSLQELIARVEAVLRRSPERPTDINEVALPDGGTADIARREVRHADGERNELSEREAELLAYLARNRGRTIARDELLARVWGITNPRGLNTRTIDMHVARLREKMRDNGTNNTGLIRTVRGKGYLFAADETDGKAAS